MKTKFANTMPWHVDGEIGFLLLKDTGRHDIPYV
jgi:hypothetical protein